MGPCGLSGQSHGEAGAPTGGALDLDGRPQFMGCLADHGQSEAGGGEIVPDGFLGAVIVLEDARQFLPRDADAVIAHDDLRRGRRYRSASHLDDPVIVRVTDRIHHQIVEQHGQMIGHGVESDRFELVFDPDTALPRGGFNPGDDVADRLAQVQLTAPRRGLSLRAQVGQLQHFLDLPREGEASGRDLFHHGVGGAGNAPQ